MTLDIPDKMFGKDMKEAHKQYLENSKKIKQTTPQPEIQNEIKVSANINLADYVRMPNSNILISKEQMFNNLDFKDSHFKLAENNLYMPSPAEFMPYYLNVIQAKQGKQIIYDGNNKPLDPTEIDSLYQRLSKNCWVWLNAGFKKDQKDNFSLINYSVKNNSLIETPKSLEKCLMKDGFADLDFNKQGLAIKPSKINEYKKNKNIYFSHPRDNSVAGFYAGSGGVGLDGLGILLARIPRSGYMDAPKARKCKIQLLQTWKVY